MSARHHSHAVIHGPIPSIATIIVLITLALLSCAIPTRSQSQPPWECKWEAQAGVTYDLCNIQLTSPRMPYYQVYEDARYEVDDNYTYFYNVLNRLVNYPSQTNPAWSTFCTDNEYRAAYGRPTGYCVNPGLNAYNGSCHGEGNLVNITAPTAAYQVNLLADVDGNASSANSDKLCFRLHDGETAPLFSLYNVNDPAEGVSVLYRNGDFCAAHDMNREVKLNFLCSNAHYDPAQTTTVSLVEARPCVYEFDIYGSFGCPLECGDGLNNEFEVCNGNGICAYDWSDFRPCCFCYVGFCDEACTTPHNQGQCAYNDQIYDIVNDSYLNTTDSVCAQKLVDQYDVTGIFDLSALQMATDFYEVTDKYEDVYSYYFELCGALDLSLLTHLSPNCDVANVAPPCMQVSAQRYNHTCLDSFPLTPKGSATQGVQYYRNGLQPEVCAWTSVQDNTMADNVPFSLQLLRNTSIGKGVSYRTYNGSYNAALGANRQFWVDLACPDSRMEYYIDDNTKLEAEVDTIAAVAAYIVRFETPLACPLQCLSISGDFNNNGKLYSVCNGRGICGSDKVAGVARCLCDTGYDGRLCSEEIHHRKKKDKSALTASEIVGIICGVLVLAVFGSTLVYCHTKRKYDKSIYESVLTANINAGDADAEDDSKSNNNNNSSAAKTKTNAQATDDADGYQNL